MNEVSRAWEATIRLGGRTNAIGSHIREVTAEALRTKLESSGREAIQLALG